MNGLAVGQLNGQPLAAAQASPLEYVAPSRRHHALAEAVCAQALAYFGLPGSLGHGEGVAEWAEGPSTRSLFPNRQTGSIGPCTTSVKFKRPRGQLRRGLDRYCSFQSDPRIRQQVGLQWRISKAVIGSRAVATYLWHRPGCRFGARTMMLELLPQGRVRRVPDVLGNDEGFANTEEEGGGGQNCPPPRMSGYGFSGWVRRRRRRGFGHSCRGPSR